jgi:hypothetical protein
LGGREREDMKKIVAWEKVKKKRAKRRMALEGGRGGQRKVTQKKIERLEEKLEEAERDLDVAERRAGAEERQHAKYVARKVKNFRVDVAKTDCDEVRRSKAAIEARKA